MNNVVLAENLKYLKTMPSESIDLIYIDPPYNTKKTQKRNKIKATISDKGVVGFSGEKYKRTKTGDYGSFEDTFENYIEFMKPRLQEAYRILKPNGSMYLHIDYREVHYIKIEMDKIFGRDNFINEVIWSYDYGAKSKSRWSAKHDNILFYVKNKNHYTFNYDKIPRIPYKAPKLVGPEKAARGKICTDVWEETIVPTNSKEKQGYATQKPLRILNRIVEVSSNPKDICLDFFAGAGSFGKACLDHDREFIMVDENKEAFDIMKNRFENYSINYKS